jgi:hypothetical protein
MWLWLRMVVAVVVMVMPGGFPVLLGYVTTRTLLARWRKAQAQANGGAVAFREVISSMHFRDLVREARAAF